MYRSSRVLITSLLVAAFAAPAAADGDGIFSLDAVSAVPMARVVSQDDSMLDLIQDFVEGQGDFLPLLGLGATANLNYMGLKDAVIVQLSALGTQATLLIPSTETVVTFAAPNPDLLYEQIEDWFEQDGAEQWADFLRESNARTPLALLSGNPRSTVALMGDSAYRKFGFDDSRSRFGYGQSRGEKQQLRIGGVNLRINVAAGSVNTKGFDEDLASLRPSVTLGGEFGRHVGLSFSIVGQYRDYNGSKMGDVGLELALPLTFKRPDRSDYFWQLTPFVQAAGGASIDAAAGGIFLGGGLVNAIGYHMERWEIQMANEIAYYNGIPVDNIVDFDFDTKLSQLLFKNGLQATYWLPFGLYADAGVSFTNFAVDDAAVSWYATPTVGVGWQAGRWMDIRIAFEADLDNNEYRSYNALLKLDFLF